MALANSAYDILGGFEVTVSSGVVTVTDGVFRNRTIGTSGSSGSPAVQSYPDSAYTAVLSATPATGQKGASGTPIVVAATGYKRIDLVVVDTSLLTTSYASPYRVITGTEVLAASTAVTPTIASSSQFPIATIAVSDSAISTRTDVRDTPDYLPVRAFNRSQAVRIGKQVVKSGSNVYVDLNDPVSAKELAYHSSIGAVYYTGSVTSAPTDLQVNYGAKAATTTGSSPATYSVTAGEIRNADNQVLYPVTGANDATTQAGAGSNTIRTDVIYLDASNPNSLTAPKHVAGTTTTTASGVNYLTGGIKFSSLNKDHIPVGVVIATGASTFVVVDIRPVR